VSPSKTSETVRVGQIWKDWDVRYRDDIPGRQLRVVEVDGEHAICETVTDGAYAERTEHLTAWAGCNAYGPVAVHGHELERHDAVEEWGIHEDSIECAVHPGSVIEKTVCGEWRRWWVCPGCNGRGGTRVSYGGVWSRCLTPGHDGGEEYGRPHSGWLVIAAEMAVAT
jgi:hypothetical protein